MDNDNQIWMVVLMNHHTSGSDLPLTMVVGNSQFLT